MSDNAKTTKQIWDIWVSIKGVAKRERKVKSHHYSIAEAHDDGTDESKPLIGGHDIQTLARKCIAAHMRQGKVEKALVLATPIVLKTYIGSDGQPYTMQERLIFNPRQFSFPVSL